MKVKDLLLMKANQKEESDKISSQFTMLSLAANCMVIQGFIVQEA